MSPYFVKRIGGRHYVMIKGRSGVAVRLQGFPSRAAALEEKHRGDTVRAVLLEPMQNAIQRTLQARAR